MLRYKLISSDICAYHSEYSNNEIAVWGANTPTGVLCHIRAPGKKDRIERTMCFVPGVQIVDGELVAIPKVCKKNQ